MTLYFINTSFILLSRDIFFFENLFYFYSFIIFLFAVIYLILLRKKLRETQVLLNFP